MPDTHYTAEEIGRIGEEIYQRDIRHKVYPQHKGEFVALDLTTGDYVVDPDDLAATKRLQALHPDAVIYGVRVGYISAYTLAGHLVEEEA